MLAGFSQTGKPRHWWSCKMLDVRRSMWRILTKSKEKNGLPNQVIDLEFGEGGLYWQSSWSPRMSQSLTLNDQLLFSSPHFNCLKDCISCELIDISHDDEKKCWHIPSCLHCKWQKWVRMGGRQQSWHQRCGPTTSGCSQGSWKEIWFLRLSFRLSVNTKQHFRC